VILVTSCGCKKGRDLLFLSSGLELRRRKFAAIEVTVTDLLLQSFLPTKQGRSEATNHLISLMFYIIIVTNLHLGTSSTLIGEELLRVSNT
jgi:hypothetical protein